ncbi:MAG: 1-deoxy-D-xylulose-5-phosphate synthase [Verrucomicrobia bacterium]|nr:1-deoxy-D-xylulose-5-phosphate synthase [Verrucomicrobiota bacterium]
MSLLGSIRGPADVRALPPALLPQLAAEVRERIVDVTARNGGHVGPNLGVVELTIALHRVFESPRDRFVFDVAHQGYVHKLLTGRGGEGFDRIRQTGGPSGFLTREEGPHDVFGAGHAGTALSAAVGLANARDRLGEDSHVVAVIGDAALTCGVTMEALNNAAGAARRLIIVLNDNEWSIDRNVGAVADILSRLIVTRPYNNSQQGLKRLLGRTRVGTKFLDFGRSFKRHVKNWFTHSSSLFEQYGVRYVGPVDGHDLPGLERYLAFCKDAPGPVILHIRTEKGRGLPAALRNPEKFHGTGAFDPETGDSLASGAPGAPRAWQDVFGSLLVREARADRRVVGVTAAMPSGTGLVQLKNELPAQYHDVGIAEEHAALFAAGLAARDLRPVCAIYSTFLQRAYDMVIHDVCLQRLPVTFCMDRAGLSPQDGATHHGLFDIAYLRCVPNVTLMQPKDEDELADMLHTALASGAPMFIRYPRGAAAGVAVKERPRRLTLGEAEVIREGTEVQVWALGSCVPDALRLADGLAASAGVRVGVVNARFVKPLDRALLLRQADAGARLFVTLEDGAVTGGFGSAVLEELSAAGRRAQVVRLGWPDRFVGHASDAATLRAAYGLSPAATLAAALEGWRRA